MARFDLVAFDCDGVLVDSEPITFRLYAEALTELGWKISAEEASARFMGLTFSQESGVIAEKIGRPVPASFFPDWVIRRDAGLAIEVEAVKGVSEVVALLRERGVPHCVVSNGDIGKMTVTLGRSQLLSWFEGKMFSATQVSKPKPAPDLYLLAARELKVDPARCVVIEDSATGVRAGKAAGMTVFGFAERNDAEKLRAAGADRIFTSMAELGEMLL